VVSTSLNEIVDGGDACGGGASLTNINNVSDTLLHRFVLVTAKNCTYEEAALAVYEAGGSVAVVIMRPGEDEVAQINSQGSVYIPIFTTSITFEDGSLLQSVLRQQQYSRLIAELDSHVIPGIGFLIDTNGQLQELGNMRNADMRILSWASHNMLRTPSGWRRDSVSLRT
jgi:hypothetical protein